MVNLRMPKGWILVGTNRSEFMPVETKEESKRRIFKQTRKIEKMITWKNGAILEKWREETESAHQRRLEKFRKAIAEGRIKTRKNYPCD